MKISRIYLQLSIYISLILSASCAGDQGKKTTSIDNKSKNDSIIRMFDTSGSDLSFLDKYHSRLTLKSKDQTFIEYLLSNPVRPDSIRKKIYIMPLGDLNEDYLKIIKKEVEYLEIFLQMPVELMESIKLDDLKKINKIQTREMRNPQGNYEKYSGKWSSTSHEQIESNSLIKYLVLPNKPADAIAILGISNLDLYIPKYNYVFGNSDLKNGAGVISTYTLDEIPYNSEEYLRKLCSKQIAHLFSIPMVKDYKCLMNFSNDLNEFMDKPFYISPTALSKLKVAIGFDHEKRFRELAEFWKKEGNETMVRYYEDCLHSMKISNGTIQ